MSFFIQVRVLNLDIAEEGCLLLQLNYSEMLVQEPYLIKSEIWLSYIDIVKPILKWKRSDST